LKDFDLGDAIKDRVLFLIGRHHHYNSVDDGDFQILVDEMDEHSIKNSKEKIFKTKTGVRLPETVCLGNLSVQPRRAQDRLSLSGSGRQAMGHGG
jgi:hypothetical protein